MGFLPVVLMGIVTTDRHRDRALRDLHIKKLSSNPLGRLNSGVRRLCFEFFLACASSASAASLLPLEQKLKSKNSYHFFLIGVIQEF